MSSVLLLATEAYARGGVQVYTRRLMEILSAYAEARRLPFYCVSLLDQTGRIDEHSNPMVCTGFFGAAGSKARFAGLAARTSWASRPDITVVAHPGVAPVSWLLRKLALAGPYVVALHGIEAWRRLELLDRKALAGAGCVVATTDYTARVFAEHNQIDGTRVIPLALQDCGLDASEGQCPKDGLNVLSVGRLVASDAYKGFDTLIAAVHNARSAGAPITLTIVGGGDDLPRLRSQAASLGLNGAVRFAGSVPDSKLHEEFQAADVFALPSRGEGFGLVYLEAMRYSRPCIGGNHGGVPELIDDGVDGYLVEHGDVNQLSDRLLTLYRDPELRRSMGLNARKKVETRYLFPHMRDRWFAVLDSVRRNQSMS